MANYRRYKKEAQMKHKWETFCRINNALITKTGLPLAYIEKQALFDDFLMHGYIDHHEDSLEFTTEKMSTDQYHNLMLLVQKYLKAGFSNPGITILYLDADNK